ncbi:MAG: hypothetical protein O3B87_01790 [bacterium]|nr:hypothetical protein [bacterium]
MFTILAANVKDVFGNISPPPGSESFANPIAGLSTVIIVGIRMALIVAGFMVLIYLLLGAIDWITSNGEEEKLKAARLKMTNAVIGIIIVVAALGIFLVVTTDILGIIKRDGSGGWQFSLPSINQCVPLNGACTVGGMACCSGYTCNGATCQP